MFRFIPNRFIQTADIMIDSPGNEYMSEHARSMVFARASLGVNAPGFGSTGPNHAGVSTP